MLKQLWNRIRGWFEDNTENKELVYKELMINEYKSVLYDLQQAHNLQLLMEVRKRIRNFQQLLIESKLQLWGRNYIIDLNKLWNAKFKYWKNKTRNG